MNQSKTKLREQLYQVRHAQQQKRELSQIIVKSVLEQPKYQQADTVMWYCHCRSEVRTREAISVQLKTNKRIVIPYCQVDESGIKTLGLWLLKDIAELYPGMWKIPEPPAERRQEPGRQISVEQLDAIVVPGVGFDRLGGRLGNGAGYYDRLLHSLQPHTYTIGIGYAVQLLESVEMQAHDVYLDMVITEHAVYKGRGRLR